MGRNNRVGMGCVVVGASVCGLAWSGAASGQLVQTDGPGLKTAGSLAGDITEPFDLAFIPSGGTQAGSFTLGLTGDANFPITPNAVSGVSIGGAVQFQVGPVPVQITPQLRTDLKVVNGGGDAAVPSTRTFLSLAVRETGSFDLSAPDVNDLGPLAVLDAVDHTMVGNGFEVFSETRASGPYVLAAGVNYTFIVDLTLLINASGFNVGDTPSSVVTLEAGGDTSWDGLSIQIAYATVPEPASGLIVPAAGAAVLLRRKRQDV